MFYVLKMFDTLMLTYLVLIINISMCYIYFIYIPQKSLVLGKKLDKYFEVP